MPSMWHKAMVYLGLTDDDELPEYEPVEQPQPALRRPVAPVGMEHATVAVRTLPPGTEPSVAQVRPAAMAVRPVAASTTARPHVIAPSEFKHAADIGDKLKAGTPVILNLQGVDRELSRRMIDFASGLTFGISGTMERAADLVFLLTPTDVEVSAEEKRRLHERGLFSS